MKHCHSLTQPAYEEQVNRILEDPEARDDDIQPIVYPNVRDIRSGVRGVPDYMPRKYQYKLPTDEERSPLGALLRQVPDNLLFVRWKRTPCTIQEFRDSEPPIWRDIMAWIEWRGEFLYRTMMPDWYPPWVQEIRDLPSIAYTDPDDKNERCYTHHFRHPRLGTVIPNGLAAALTLAALEIPHHCYLTGRQFVAPPVLWEFSQDSFLPRDTEEDTDLVDEFDKAWAAIRALTYSSQVTFCNEYPEPEKDENHDVYTERLRVVLLGKPYQFWHSLLAEAYRKACSPFVDLPIEHVRPFWDYNGHFVRPFLPLRRVCHRVKCICPPPTNLIETQDVGAWNECNALDPRNEAAPLNGYEWGIPQTPSVVQARLEHRRSVQNHGPDVVVLRLDLRGRSTSRFPTTRFARRYADCNYGKVWLHDDDGGDPHVFREH